MSTLSLLLFGGGSVKDEGHGTSGDDLIENGAKQATTRSNRRTAAADHVGADEVLDLLYIVCHLVPVR